jgi:hypothetical protein
MPHLTIWVTDKLKKRLETFRERESTGPISVTVNVSEICRNALTDALNEVEGPEVIHAKEVSNG